MLTDCFKQRSKAEKALLVQFCAFNSIKYLRGAMDLEGGTEASPCLAHWTKSWKMKCIQCVRSKGMKMIVYHVTYDRV